MAKRTFLAGATSQTMDVFLQDSSSTIGAGLSGLVFNTANLKAYYRKGATGTLTAITLATQTVGGAWSSGGFVEIDATNGKGQYRFDIPDTILASTPYAVIHFYGAANLAQNFSELEIVSYNPFDAVRLGLTALPNVASGSAGAIPTTGTGANQISVSSGQVILQSGTGTGQLSFTSGILKVDVDTIKTNPVVNAGTVTFPTNATLASTTNITAGTIATVTTVTNQLTAAAIATGVWQDATAGDFTTASSIGKALYVSNIVPGAAGGHFIAGTNAATTITTGLTTHFIGTVDTVTTYTGNTVQTGDSYARIGAPVGASISADIAAVPAAVWAVVIDGTNTAIKLMRGFTAALLGKASGLATTNAKYRNIGDSKNVIDATVDSDGNRSAITLDLT